MKRDDIINYNCNGKLPGKKYFTETQYSFVKRRSGKKIIKESIPFLRLKEGEHKICFYNKKENMLCLVKIWVSPFGWAWILKNNTE